MPSSHDPRRLSPWSALARAGDLARTGLLLVAAAFAVGLASFEQALALAGAVAAASLAYGVAYHRRFTYRLAEDTFEVRSGVLGRQHREVPYGRIQNASLQRNLVQRLLGLAEVSVETAGAHATEIHLRYVTEAEALRLQEAIAERTRRAQGDEDDAAAPPEAELLFEIGGRELAVLGLASFDARLAALVLVALAAAPSLLVEALVPFPAMAVAPVLAAAVYLFGAVASGVVAVANHHGFRIEQLGDELRYDRGLVQRVSGSIPLAKIQRLTLTEPVLARWLGFAGLSVETAGATPGETTGSTTAVPLARRPRAEALARRIEPFEAPALDRPPSRARERYVVRYALVAAALAGAAYAVSALVYPFPWAWSLLAFLVAPAAAHLKWANLGVDLQEGYLVTRRGFFTRRTHVVPLHRVQAVERRQTVFQRRRDLATVLVDTAGGGGLFGDDAVALDLDADEAARLRETVHEGLHRRRRAPQIRREPREAGETGADPAA